MGHRYAIPKSLLHLPSIALLYRETLSGFNIARGFSENYGRYGGKNLAPIAIIYLGLGRDRVSIPTESVAEYETDGVGRKPLQYIYLLYFTLRNQVADSMAWLAIHPLHENPILRANISAYAFQTNQPRFYHQSV